MEMLDEKSDEQIEKIPKSNAATYRIVHKMAETNEKLLNENEVRYTRINKAAQENCNTKA